MKLDVSDDDLVACVSCGLCLPHCPTYRVTGDESASPRGRIAAMRAVHFDGAEADDSFKSFMDLCVQCRGCETACPSSVPFGRLMEGTRQTLAREAKTQPLYRRVGYSFLGHHRLVLVGSSLLAVAQRLRLVPKRLGLSKLPVRRAPLVPSAASLETADVILFTGCVMDAWMRDTHLAAQRVVEATGATVAFPGPGGACCGALHVHAGLHDETVKLAERVMRSLPGNAAIVVDSAGCGAAMKDYGHLVGTPEAEAFSKRVFDIHEWLAARADRLPVPRERLPFKVAVQDPCHLRHVQRAHAHVRTVLAPYVDLVELDDEGLCCGAGGAYSAIHPDMAGDIRERKVASIGRAGAPVVASANPGCAMHLAATGLDVRHPIELVDEALRSGTSPARRPEEAAAGGR